MNIYKIEFHNGSDQVVTASDKEDVRSRYTQDNIKDIEGHGPYVRKCMYNEIRKELL